MEIFDVRAVPVESQAGSGVGAGGGLISPSMTPVAASERIGVIDILRGLALFGILAANMRGFNAPFEVYGDIAKLFPGRADQIAQALIDAVISGKGLTLFSFLFGLGFAVQMSRAEERGQSVSFYPRRLWILLGLGLIHAWLFWAGDILVCYALTGFLLFLFHKQTQKTIAIWAISLTALPLVVVAAATVVAHFGIKISGGEPDNPASVAQNIQSSIQIFRDGSYWPMAVRRFRDWRDANGDLPLVIPLLILPRFLAGLWVWRSGLLKDPNRYMPVVKQVMGCGLLIGLLMEMVVLVLGVRNQGVSIRLGSWPFLLETLSFLIAPVGLAAFYAGGVLMLAQIPAWRTGLTPLAAVGRMALTNYLAQSLFFVWFFRLTHTFGAVGPAWGLVPTVVFFALQIGFSVWWLRRYQFGPVEWAWRSLTYGVTQPMRRSNQHLLHDVAGDVG